MINWLLKKLGLVRLDVHIQLQKKLRHEERLCLYYSSLEDHYAIQNLELKETIELLMEALSE